MQRIKTSNREQTSITICTKCGLPQGVDNLFAAQAIAYVLKSEIYSGILPRVVEVDVPSVATTIIARIAPCRAVCSMRVGPSP